ncbi:alanine:cation symporter family protein, partial [Blautia obeum]
FVQAFSVYVDTLFVCSATGFMLLMTGKYNVYNASNQFIVQNLPGVEVGPAFTQSAVDTLIPGFGSAFVAVAL